ncbi:hypothetical protein ACHAXM_002612, partial [Skeletonema potamos]
MTRTVADEQLIHYLINLMGLSLRLLFARFIFLSGHRLLILHHTLKNIVIGLPLLWSFHLSALNLDCSFIDRVSLFLQSTCPFFIGSLECVFHYLRVADFRCHSRTSHSTVWYLAFCQRFHCLSCTFGGVFLQRLSDDIS